MPPSELLREFQRECCPEISFSDPMLTARLIEEISRLKQELKGEGKNELQQQ